MASKLAFLALRQSNFRKLYKQNNPLWDDSLGLLLKLFKPFVKDEMPVLDAGFY